MSLDDLMGMLWGAGGLALFGLSLCRARLSAGDARLGVAATFVGVGAAGIAAALAAAVGYVPHAVDLLVMAAFVCAQGASAKLWRRGTPSAYRRGDTVPMQGRKPRRGWRRVSDWMGLS